MSRLVSALGLSATLLVACTWADCKTDAKAGALALIDCGPGIFAHVVTAVHEGRDGWMNDVATFSGDAGCLKSQFDRHLAEAHACADASGATCAPAPDRAELRRFAIAKAILSVPFDGGVK